MNDLSWLIYLADIAGSVGGLLTFLAVIAGATAVVSLIVTGIAVADRHLETAAASRRIFRQAMPAGIVVGLIAGFMPGRQTVMMIAASEILEHCVDLGGTLSGEHGIGSMKLPFMRKAVDPITLQCLWNARLALDPSGTLNPGKVLPTPGGGEP